MTSGWGVRWHDDGRTEMRGPGEPDFVALTSVGFELDDLHLLRQALLFALDRLDPPPPGVGGLDRPMTEHDELGRLLDSVDDALVQPAAATY